MKKIEPDYIFEAVPPKASPNDWCAIDLEVFGADKKKLHRPIGTFASLSITYDGKTAFVITDQADLALTMERIQDATLIIQNAMYDVRQLRRWIDFPRRKNLWDTMIIEKELFNGYYDSAGLAAMTRRYLEIYMEKETRDLFEKATKMTPEMIRYNAIDALATWKVAEKQRGLMKSIAKKVYDDVDLPAMWAFLEFKGVKIDIARWEEIARENEAKVTEMFPTFPFNPNAPEQARTYFNRELKLKLPDTESDTLKRHAHKHQIIRDLLEYRMYQTRASRYGMNWIKNYIEEDGRVYPEWGVIGAETGRTIGSPVHNVPVRDTPVYRECFIADDGRILVGGDYSAQEVRSAAYLSQDDALISILNSGKDPHCEIARVAFGHPVVKGDKERDDAKGVLFGLIYGETPYGLALKLGITEEDAVALIQKVLNPFPNLRHWLDDIQKSDKWVRTAYGRKCWLNHYNSQVFRNMRNSPNQGTGADMIKMAQGFFVEEWDTNLEPVPLVLEVHDELVAEPLIENAFYCKELLESCMIKAGNKILPGILITVGIKQGQNWAQVH